MDCVVEGEYEFSGIGHIISIKAQNGKLDIEVTNGLTNQAWESTFDASFIEGMTKKTGNFKQFHVFVNMLRSAILKTTDSVWLDLLSYADLEKLRCKKTGIEAPVGTASTNNASYNKRYLILMYNVEFDRIHFPLPLNPLASTVSSDASQVHAVVVRELQNEIRNLKNRLASDYRIIGYEELKRDYERIVEEKHALEDGYRQLQEEYQMLNDNGSAKQVRMLKNVIRQLEQDVVEMKTTNQHATTRKDKEIKALSIECDDLRSSERMLKARVKSLAQELQTFKRYNASKNVSRNTSINSDHESKLSNRIGVGYMKPSPKARFSQSGSFSAREYGNAVSKAFVNNRSRSTSRDAPREPLRNRNVSRSPSTSRLPIRLPRQQQVDIQLSAGRRSSKGPNERPVLPPFRFTSRSPSPSSKLVSNTQRGALVNSGSRGMIARGVRTPSVSSIASNNSDLSIAFGNSSFNNNQNQSKSYLRRAPVAKAVAAGIRPSVQNHVPRRQMPTKQQKATIRDKPLPKRQPSNDSLSENYIDDDFSIAKAIDRPLEDSQIHNRAAEMMEIDARLKRLHCLLKENEMAA